MYVIKDSVHGNIKLTVLERSIVDSPGMQRLRGIKQLGLTNLVYPGANHTRFEHSLGTLHLTGEICENIQLGEEESFELRAAALLHDIGHGAFSHESDYFLKKYLGETHESVAAKKLEEPDMARLLEKEGLRPARVASLICGKGLGAIITSGVGSDRMDYLLRDSYYTGVAYGVIDADRLIHTMCLRGGSVVLDDGGLEAAESLLIARFLMFSTVYSHHAVRIASAMLKLGIEFGIRSSALRPADLVSLDDSGVMLRLLSDARAGRLIRLIENRELYKRALVLDWATAPKAAKAMLQKGGERGLASEIASEAGVPEDEVLVDVPMQQTKDVDDVLLLLGDRKVTLASASDLVRSIKATVERRLRLIIACPAGSVKKVKKAARKSLGNE